MDQEWNSPTSLTNGVSYHVGRSFESEPLDQEPQSASKTTSSFTEYDSQKMEMEIGNSKLMLPELKSASPYKLTVDDLKKTQGGSRSKTSSLMPMKPVVLYAEVKRGDWPVLGARVEVIVTKRTGNDSSRYRERFELLDSGSGGEYRMD